MKKNSFIYDADSLNTLSRMLNIDADIISRIGKNFPIGLLMIEKGGQITFPNHWMTNVLQKRYPNLDSSLQQIITIIGKAPLPIDKELMWHYRIKAYHHPLDVQFFPHRVPGLIRLADYSLIAIHHALANSVQFHLTPRQTLIHVINMATGLSNQAIANALFLSVETVKKHLKNIREKQTSLPLHEQRPVAMIAPGAFAIAPWYIE